MEHKHHPGGCCAVGSLEQAFQIGSTWTRWEPQICLVGHKVFKRKLNQLPMFLPFVKPLFAHSFRKGDWGPTEYQDWGGHPCPHRVDVLMG